MSEAQKLARLPVAYAEAMRKGGPFARHNPTEAAIHAINEVAASWPEVQTFWRRLVKANPVLAGVDVKTIERGIAAAMSIP